MEINFHQYSMILLGSVLVNNIVLVKILGLCPFMGVSKKLEASLGMAAATAFVLTIGSMTSWAIYTLLLEPNHLEYLRTLSFIVIRFEQERVNCPTGHRADSEHECSCCGHAYGSLEFFRNSHKRA